MNDIFKFLINLPQTLFFNFFYLPINQAIYLPIWLYGIKFKKLQGKIIIDNKKIRYGMIRLGPRTISLYETTKTRFIWENRGICCFKGSCIIGSNSAISTGINGYLEFGNNFSATTTLKIVCYKSILIGENTRISWENIIIDTDFHETINIETGEKSIPSKQIKIGKNNWIGIRTTILKGTETPDFCIVGAGSLLNKKYDVPSYSLIAGNPPKLLKTGILRDLNSLVH